MADTYKCPDCDSKVMEKTNFCLSCKKKVKNESINEAAVDVTGMIKALGNTDWGEDNEAQMKAVQILKGLAVSEDPKSNSFMKALSSASTGIAKKIGGSDEAVKEDVVEKTSDEIVNESLENIRNSVSRYL